MNISNEITFVAFLFLFFGCDENLKQDFHHKSKTVYLSGYTQGTTYSIQYVDTLTRDFSFSVDSLLQRFDT